MAPPYIMTSSEDDLPLDLVRKFNSTSTLYVNSTITAPNVNTIIQAVATIIHSQLLEDVGKGQTIKEDSELYFFCEEKYISANPQAFDEQRLAMLRRVPTVESIYDFSKALYDCAQFSPECCIISLVYINRLIAFTGMPLLPTNWRPMMLCSLLVAQKVWDDRYLSNSDFSYIYPFFTTEEINRLEQKFLEALQYSMTVKAALYAKYYFELRGLFNESASEFPLKPLDKHKAAELEGRSTHVGKMEEDKARRFSNTAGVRLGPASYSVIN